MRMPLKIENKEVIIHYDSLIDEGNDPVLDCEELKAYMELWDGQTFIDLLELKKDKSVLEIGCGTGRIALKVAPNVERFLGVDISLKTVERAKQHLKKTCAEFFKGDFLCLKTEEKFDLIYSSLTFMHFKNKLLAIQKVKSLLKEGGKFVLSIDKNQSPILECGDRKLEIYPDTKENIVQILIQENFKNISISEVEFAYIICAENVKN